jgi:hypothetical protein
MSPEMQTVLNDLRERLARLEQDRVSPRGRTNLAGAARYLGISDETLRQQHLRGEGPRRTRMGRHWSYAFADLDTHAQGPPDTAA